MTQTSRNDEPAPVIPHHVIGGVPLFVIAKAGLFFALLAISPLTFRYLGKEQYGVLSLCKNIAGWAVVACCMGLNTSLTRFLPELQAGGNRAGAIRLLWKTVALQTGAVILFGAALVAMKPWLNHWFKTDFQFFLPLTALLVASRVGRTLVEDTLAAFYRVKTTSVLTAIQGFLLCGSIAVLLRRFPTVETSLLIETCAVGVIAAYGLYLIAQHVRALPQTPGATRGIGMRRIVKTSGPTLFGAVATMFTSQYSEVFFLGYFYSATIAGQYDIGCIFPLMLVTALPLALQNLFTSIFSGAYVREPSSLGRLVSAYYRVLMLAILPLSAFGVFLGGDIIKAVYGDRAQEAVNIAPFFFAMHTLTLISTPLSIAIIAREKVLNMTPLLVLTAGINVFLDWLLIPRYEAAGAMAAVLITFVTTIPLRLYVVARLIDGIYFPLTFFLKTAVLFSAVAYGFSFIPHPATFVPLALVGAAYGVCILAVVRWGRIVTPRDFDDLRAMRHDKLNAMLDRLLGGRATAG